MLAYVESAAADTCALDCRCALAMHILISTPNSCYHELVVHGRFDEHSKMYTQKSSRLNRRSVRTHSEVATADLSLHGLN